MKKTKRAKNTSTAASAKVQPKSDTRGDLKWSCGMSGERLLEESELI
ncbi:MAG: hypothetical protein PUJ80_03230 [Verrucomicrobiota bacterium]|nr:hypothetical protein [Verrucomicrobiota bacterium]MDY5596637.1 hypothetical protein [Kiritimatiellia bacterium]